jgi:hypothetical protein
MSDEQTAIAGCRHAVAPAAQLMRGSGGFGRESGTRMRVSSN